MVNRRCARLGLLLCTACTAPGTYGRGEADVAVGGPGFGSWRGSCEYAVSTRWATRLPHRIVMADTTGLSIAISLRRAPGSGRFDLVAPIEGGEDAIALAMDGHTVRGGIAGTIEISARDDTTRVDVTGRLVGRDAAPVRATCRYVAVPRERG